MHKGLVPFLSAKEIHQIIKKLASEIKKDYLDKELIVICPLRGSIFFLSDLIRELNIPVQVDFVFIDSVAKDSFRIRQDISTDIKGKHVLITDGIIDSGLTMSFLIERMRLGKPASLKTAVLLDKSSHRRVFVHIDYVGKVIEDRFIVGYGMNLDGEGRNYPDIYLLGQ